MMKVSDREKELSGLVMQLDKQIKQLSKDLTVSAKRVLELEEMLEQAYLDNSLLIDHINSVDC